MKLELYRDGQLYMTIEHIGQEGENEFEVIPKRLVKDSQLSAKTFEELYFKFVPDSKSYPEAYEKAEGIHEKYFEKRRYSSYDSFRKMKDRK